MLRAHDRELKANEERLRLGSQAAGFATFTFDYETKTTRWSPELLAICGLPPQTPAPFDEAGLPTFIHPDDRSAMLQAGRAASDASGEGLLNLDFRVLHPGAPVRWLRLSGKTTFTPSKRPARLAGALTDVTQARQLEEQLRALAARLQSARELEQARIARDLHDDLTQLLAGLSHHLLRLEDRVQQTSGNGWLEDWVVEATELVGQAHASVRRIASGLRPRLLDSLGLAPALKLEATRFSERSGVTCEVLVGGLPELQLPVVTALYRITQEALTNVSRHAAASRVTISLGLEGDAVVLRVEDDGRGLQGGSEAANGLGLLGMRERAALLGGEVRLEANPSGGLTVIAALPHAAAALAARE